MRYCLAVVVLFFIVPISALAFEPKEHIYLASCDGAGPDFLVECAGRQLDACVIAADATDNGYMWSRTCDNEAFEQADQMLNDFYQFAILKTKALERMMAGSVYTGQEALLRKSQRAWLDVRDATCELNVLYGAVHSGYEAVIAGCEAKMTIQRIADLQREIGYYLN